MNKLFLNIYIIKKSYKKRKKNKSTQSKNTNSLEIHRNYTLYYLHLYIKEI